MKDINSKKDINELWKKEVIKKSENQSAKKIPIAVDSSDEKTMRAIAKGEHGNELQEKFLDMAKLKRKYNMENLKGETCKYWIVKLGELFYVEGIKRISLENDNASSYEFCNDENLAFLFIMRESAERIANEVGGIVIEKEMTIEKAMELSNRKEAYTKSELIWEKKQIEDFIKDLKNNR